MRGDFHDFLERIGEYMLPADVDFHVLKIVEHPTVIQLLFKYLVHGIGLA